MSPRLDVQFLSGMELLATQGNLLSLASCFLGIMLSDSAEYLLHMATSACGIGFSKSRTVTEEQLKHKECLMTIQKDSFSLFCLFGSLGFFISLQVTIK